MNRHVQALLTVGLLFTAASWAQQPPAPDALQMDVNQARKDLARTARTSCLIEYQNPNLHAQLMSIGWETGAFCACLEARCWRP